MMRYMPERSAWTSSSGHLPDPARLTADGFAARFQESSRALWCIAAAVVGDRTLADDVLQEAAMVALSKLEQFDAQTSFAAWMSQIVRYVGLNHRRSRQRARVRPVDPDSLSESCAVDEGAPASIDHRGSIRLDQADFDDQVVAALQTLEETPRACLLLRTLLEMTYREIAQALSIPEGTAMSHVHRSRKAMRAALSSSAPTSSTNPGIPHA